MSPRDKPLAWLRGEVKTPPFSQDARIEAGFLLRRLQQGESIGMPHSRPMPAIGAGCHELRIVDQNRTWRIVYHIEADVVVILDVVSKKTPATPATVISDCRKRLETFQTLSQRNEANAKRQT